MTITRRSILAGTALALSGCADQPLPFPPVPTKPVTDGYFEMSDGARLPYRTWLPASEPTQVILALHGFNDSRDAWEIPAPNFQAAGMAIWAPDQRGFGAAPDRDFWPGTARMTEDAATMASLLRQRFPRTRLVVMGESMGGAIAMTTATLPNPPDVDAYVMLAPAVWSRAQMNIFLTSGLWLVSNVAPGWKVTGQEVPIHIRASDNRDALIALARDPLTIRETRFSVLRGLTNLMGAAQDAARRFTAPGFFLYGAQDQLVPPDAMAATWRDLPAGARRGFYPNGYHLLFRDLDRAAPIGDVISWLQNPALTLPSGADIAAAAWLATQG
jgi:acylglycerol lipase